MKSEIGTIFFAYDTVTLATQFVNDSLIFKRIIKTIYCFGKIFDSFPILILVVVNTTSYLIRVIINRREGNCLVTFFESAIKIPFSTIGITEVTIGINFVEFIMFYCPIIIGNSTFMIAGSDAIKTGGLRKIQ